jgi:superfamily II DNA or RNA helicase
MSDSIMGTPAAIAILARADAAATALSRAEGQQAEASRAAHRAFENARTEAVATQLETLDLEHIKTIIGGRMRLGPVESAGYRSVLDICRVPAGILECIHGVGPTSVGQMKAAAEHLRRVATENLEVRIDSKKRPGVHEALLRAVQRQEHIQRALAEHLDGFSVLPRLRKLRAQGELAKEGTVRRFFTRIFSGRERLDEAESALRQLQAMLASPELGAQLTLAERLNEPLAPGRVWTDFLSRPADYYGFLRTLGVKEADASAAAGRLPPNIIEAVRGQSLNEALLRGVSLRGYQSFGARYALVQRRVVLGDEMGLGKTIQALAVIAHLAAKGETGFLVVCPAAVVANWASETRRKTMLNPAVIHGSPSARVGAFRSWMGTKDVGIMSYETARSLYEDGRFGAMRPALLVVDEAHYVKNAGAGRSRAVAAVAEKAGRVLFMSGTPLENRLEELFSLIGYLQPGVVRKASPSTRASAVVAPASFRMEVAPVYLRRNQEDVLMELPDRIQSDEWLSLRSHERAVYHKEVIAGNFMGMRRAVIVGDGTSDTAKLERLNSIIEEASADGCKVLVFSFFRAVIDTVMKRAPGAFGPIHGGVQPLLRQKIIDEFTAAPAPAVLVAQIQAGGTGLNIQAASVVILMEPQIKPSLEEQAVARAHRMGQTRRVQVFRLLAAESVDERMIELLKVKGREFNEYARESSVKDAAPEAIDISDTGLAREIVRIEQDRLSKVRASE